MAQKTLHNWVLCRPDLAALIAKPEHPTPFLFGEMQSQPGYSDGEGLYTSTVIGADRNTREVYCKTGECYKLGEVSPKYEEDHPGAENRFFSQWVRGL